MPDREAARRELLARLLEERRVDLGLQWREVARRAGVSYETLRHARFGPGEPDPLTVPKIERALGMERGSIRRLLSGEADMLPLAPAHPAPELLPPAVRENYTDPVVRQIWEAAAISEGARLGLITHYLDERDSADPPADQASGN